MAFYLQHLVTTLCCLLPVLLDAANEAGQSRHLRRFIRSRRSSGSGVVSDTPLHVGPQDGLMEADKVTELPGQPFGVEFDQYAGYVTVDPAHGRALFYYFVESPQSSAKPLVLWLNGGPGCSSFIGAMEEIGPFRVHSDGETLYKNDYAWNNVANIIFLESPAGVGFSYSNTTADISTNNDDRTSRDSYIFMLNWFERYPQYKGREFYIMGESYAAHYVPQLASTIYRNNNSSNQSTINLQGIVVGNGFFDDNDNARGKYDYLWSHALISDHIYELIQMKCKFSSDKASEECKTALDAADKEAGNIDFYNVYAPVCRDSSKSNRTGVLMADYDPCTDNYVSRYLNIPSVQKALHANVTAHIPQPWQVCSDQVFDKYKDSPTTMLPTIKFLLDSGIRMWFYSGDIDSVCPTISTRYFIKSLGLTITKPWRPWYLKEEVGGYVEEYNGITLATVRGAGHQVPSNQPERALMMISSFLQGKLPPP